MRISKYTDKIALKKLAKRKRITYRKIAEITGMSLNAINNKMNGYTDITVTEAKLFMSALSIKAEEMAKYFCD